MILFTRTPARLRGCISTTTTATRLKHRTNYKGMVLYDLAVLYLTALPAIAHDSLIQKNISDGAIDGIMKIYTGTEKQVFIAFDKQDSYRESTRKILADNSVLKLSDENSELYGESWNKEERE